jgi:DNA-nicking Smr family endonuclease
LKRRDKQPSDSDLPSEEDFASLLEDHLHQNPPTPKTEEPKILSKPRSKKSGMAVRTVDLHGMSLADAKLHLRNLWLELKAGGKHQIVLRIITGKGLHSGNTGPVLVEEIHDFVVSMFGQSIARIDENPAKVRLSGLPIRGHFDVEILIK